MQIKTVDATIIPNHEIEQVLQDANEIKSYFKDQARVVLGFYVQKDATLGKIPPDFVYAKLTGCYDRKVVEVELSFSEVKALVARSKGIDPAMLHENFVKDLYPGQDKETHRPVHGNYFLDGLQMIASSRVSDVDLKL